MGSCDSSVACGVTQHHRLLCPAHHRGCGEQLSTESNTPSTLLVKVGVYCLRGNGHWACYDEEGAAACGTKGPNVYIEVDLEDYAMYPEWLQKTIDYEREERAYREAVRTVTARRWADG